MKNGLFLMMFAAVSMVSCSPTTGERATREGTDTTIQDDGTTTTPQGTYGTERDRDPVEDRTTTDPTERTDPMEQRTDPMNQQDTMNNRQNDQNQQTWNMGQDTLRDRGAMGQTWQLESYGKEDNLQNLPADQTQGVVLMFDLQNNQLSGKTGCNEYTGSINQESDTYRFGNVSGGTSTTDCPESVRALETYYINMLNRIDRYSMEGERLVLHTEDGQRLVFRMVDKQDRDDD